MARAVGSNATPNVFIKSDNKEYSMRRIREKYLSNSTVTLVFIGKESWTRKFIDWEIASSLNEGSIKGKRNGLLAILSPSLKKARLPQRFVDNYKSGYAKFYPYPKNKAQLQKWIDEAYAARSEKANLIKNSKRKLRRNLNPNNDAGNKPEFSPNAEGSYNIPYQEKNKTRRGNRTRNTFTIRKPYL